MSKLTQERTAPPAGPASRVAGDIACLVLAAGSILCAVALATHDPADASWGAATGVTQVSNAAGPFGANLAYALFQVVGWMAWLVPVALLGLSVSLFLRRSARVGLATTIGGTLLILSGAAIASLGFGEAAGARDVAAGGIVGRVLAAGCRTALGEAGAWILTVTTACASLLLLTRVTLGTALSRLGGGLGIVARALAAAAARMRAAWASASAARAAAREARRAEKAAAAEAAAAAPAPRRAVSDDARPAISRPATAETKAPAKVLRLRFGLPRSASGDDDAKQASEAPPAPPASAEPRPTSRRLAATSKPPTPAAATAPPRPTPPVEPMVREVAEDDDEAEVATTPTRSSDSRFIAPAAREVAATAEPAAAAPAVGHRATIARAVRKADARPRDFRLPPTTLLDDVGEQATVNEAELMECARQIVDKCAEFGVGGQVLHIHPGPVVTTFELKPDAGVKFSRICSLEDDLAMALKAETIRIDRIPGKSTVGIEVPNRNREVISFRELAESDVFQTGSSKLTMILGKTIDGAPYVADLAKMPHLLIAGSTGSGKSVALNSLITSMLFKARPEEVKLILVDPKMLELGMYKDIPHLLTPVVTNPKLASNALKWAVKEMEHRYARLAGCGVRNIEQYNAWVTRQTESSGQRPTAADGSEHTALPFIVIVIDELADLMMIAAADVEDSICRLAQMARAVGIHLILATQRPSVDVITGVIKANLPARIAMRVASKVDSRTILDSNGSEQLLGKGDMLFLPTGSSRLMRLHGPYLSETETAGICDYLRTQLGPVYDEGVCEEVAGLAERGEASEKDDELFEQAARIVVERGEASVSYLQRRLKIGYSRAARLVDMLEEDGIVGPADGSKARDVLVGPDYFGEIDRARQANGVAS